MSRLDELKKQQWFQVLSEEAKKTNITEAARKIGYDRSSISLVLSGKYNGGTDNVAAKVMEIFTDKVFCPFLDADISKGECNDFHTRNMPTSQPNELRHWQACRGNCPHGPNSQEGFSDA